MKKMIMRRLLLGVFIMVFASLLSFTLLYIAPGNPAESILMQRTGEDPSYEEIELFLQQKDLDVPMVTQITKWLYMGVRFDFGESIDTSQPVMEEFFDRFKATMKLALISLVVSVPLALFIGVRSAAKNNRSFDHFGRFFTLLGMSIPEFWLGLMLMIIFSQTLNWLPSFGYGSYQNLIMPVATLVVGHTASLSRIVRSSMLENLSQDYITMARGNGLPKRIILINYALRNSLGPIVTAFGSQLGHLLAGSVVVETVFSWPGIGKFLIDSVYARDYPVIQGFVLLIALMFVVINLITDILYAYIDPRIRYERG